MNCIEHNIEKVMTLCKHFIAATVITILFVSGTHANDGALQSEKEFQEFMPITGTVEACFGNFNLDHSFPSVGEADKIYDLMLNKNI